MILGKFQKGNKISNLFFLCFGFELRATTLIDHIGLGPTDDFKSYRQKSDGSTHFLPRGQSRHCLTNMGLTTVAHRRYTGNTTLYGCASISNLVSTKSIVIFRLSRHHPGDGTSWSRIHFDDMPFCEIGATHFAP
jgi:hypothetical protein